MLTLDLTQYQKPKNPFGDSESECASSVGGANQLVALQDVDSDSDFGVAGLDIGSGDDAGLGTPNTIKIIFQKMFSQNFCLILLFIFISKKRIKSDLLERVQKPKQADEENLIPVPALSLFETKNFH